MTTPTPANETSAPASFAGVRMSDRATTASSAVRTGVAVTSRAESPAGIDCRAVAHRTW